MARAVPARRAEHAHGRACARAALRALGADAVDLPAGPDRAPRWPRGFRGSIAHDAGVCLAAVARAADVRRLGIDVGPAAPLPPELVRVVAPEAAGSGPLVARLAFGAKEAAFKAVSADLGALLGPDEVVAHVREDGRFRVERSDGLAVCGRWAVHDGLALSAVALV